MTPYEGMQGKKPTLEHFKVFSYVAHVKVPSTQLTKLSDRSEKLIYLRNEEGTKGYRLQNPNRNKICVSRDIVFEEQKKWVRSKAQSTDPFSVMNRSDLQVM